MEGDIRLGRIGGIPIAISWSLLVIAAMLTWILATSVLPLQAEGFASGTYWAAALIGAVVFFACVLAHELGHALVGGHFGMRTESITLWLLGGVARLKDEAPTPKAELLMAGAGPLTSLLLGGVFAAIAFGLGAAGSSPIVAAFGWLAFINVLLAVFNLLPGAPLDGGRVLRAIIWARCRDHDRAAVLTARVGRAVGWGIGGLGVMATVATASMSGLWLLLIAWFMVSAATTEESYYRMRGTLRGATVRDALGPRPAVVPGWYTIEEALAAGFVPTPTQTLVIEGYDGTPSGVLAGAALAAVPFHARAHTRVLHIAVPLGKTVTCGLDEALTDVLSRLATEGARFALVLGADARPLGAFTLGDLQRLASYWERARSSHVGDYHVTHRV